MPIELVLPTRGYFERAVRALRGAGWRIASVPEDKRLPANKWLRLTLQTPAEEIRLRLLIYAVGSSARGNPDERRVQSTTTYASDLPVDPSVQDVVLGWERDLHVFVGLDPLRLHAGGDEHNASSFVDQASLAQAATAGHMIVTPRPQRVLAGREVEHHAYFQPRHLTEYLFEQGAVHAGRYRAGGPWAQLRFREYRSALAGPDGAVGGSRQMVMTRDAPPSREPEPPARGVERFERTGSPGRPTTPEEFQRILRRMAENGDIGEHAVFDRERRRLREAGHPDLAERVTWTARENVAAGYDVSSFFDDGGAKLIEVKSTEGTAAKFEISSHEWATAARLGDAFVIVRVTKVRTADRKFAEYRDPRAMARNRQLLVETGTRLVRPA